MQPPVILVIPAWDEAESIGAVLSEVPPELVGEVVVVVGSSADPTAAVAAAHGAPIIIQSRPGYGAACWQGAREAAALGAEIVVFLDGDYADPPMELAQVMGPVLADEADLVLGCRNVSAHPGALPLHARFGNRLVLIALRVLLGGSGLCDLPSFKAIRVEVLEALEMREMTLGWTVEMVVLEKTARDDLRIAQVPINYRTGLAGRSKVSGTVRGSLRAAWTLVTCAARYAHWTPPSVRTAEAG